MESELEIDMKTADVEDPSIYPEKVDEIGEKILNVPERKGWCNNHPSDKEREVSIQLAFDATKQIEERAK